MGNYSKFIHATGNGRIMLSKIRKYLQDISENPKLYSIILNDILELRSSIIQVDQDGEEFVVLEDVGKLMSGWKIYGYLKTDYVRDFYRLYECMSINGMSCYESKIKVEEVDKSIYNQYFDISIELSRALYCGMNYRPGMELQTIEGYLKKSNNSFDSIESLKRFLLPFIDNPFANDPIIQFSPSTQVLHDISIVTTSSELIDSYETVKKKRKSDNNESCKLYFLAEYELYFYLEFLPYGEGIKIGVVRNYPNLDENSDDEDSDEELKELFCQTRDEAFSWYILTLQ